MANAEYALKVINLLRREANAKSGLGSDSRLGKSALTVKQLEKLEDDLEREITRPMAGEESVTEFGEQLAREIVRADFPGIKL